MELHQTSPIGTGTVLIPEERIEQWRAMSYFLVAEDILTTKPIRDALLSYYKKNEKTIQSWLKERQRFSFADYFKDNSGRMLGLPKDRINQILLAFTYLHQTQSIKDVLNMAPQRYSIRQLGEYHYYVKKIMKVHRRLEAEGIDDTEAMIEIANSILPYDINRQEVSMRDNVMDFAWLITMLEVFEEAPLIYELCPSEQIEELEQDMLRLVAHLVPGSYGTSEADLLKSAEDSQIKELLLVSKRQLKVANSWYRVKGNCSVNDYLSDIKTILRQEIDERNKTQVYENLRSRSTITYTDAPGVKELMAEAELSMDEIGKRVLESIREGIKEEAPDDLFDDLQDFVQLEYRISLISSGSQDYSFILNKPVSNKVILEVMEQLVFDIQLELVSSWKSLLYRFFNHLIRLQMSDIIANETKEITTETVVFQEDTKSKAKLKEARGKIAELEKANRKLNRDIAQLDRLRLELDQLKQEKEELIELLAHQQPIIIETRPTEKLDTSAVVAALNSPTTVLVGGHPQWQHKMAKVLPEAVFLDGREYHHNISRNTTTIVFNTTALNHSMYYLLMREVRNYKDKYQVYYVSSQTSSVEASLRELALQHQRR